MAFRDIRLPVAISFHATGGPGFSTDVAQTDGGDESTNQNWEQELGAWEIGYDARMPAVWRALLAFFRIVAGRAHTFRFKDWLDFEAGAGEGVFVLVTSTTFQMYHRYTVGSYTYDKLVTKPVAETIVVTGGTTPSVGANTGIVTVASGTPTAWTGEYDKHCRFDIDRPSFSILDKNPDGGFIVGWTSIPIVEVRN